MTNETIELDPAEFIPERVALGLDELGIRIVGAPDWGDAEHELFLVKQEKGEIPADRHPPNRTVTIKLKAEEDDEHAVSLAKALAKLQMKIGVLQEEGGWVKRILDIKGGYTTDVGMVVHTAVLGGVHGWMMAHRSVAPEITLTLTTGPYCYGTKEIASAEFKVNEARKIDFEIPNVQGTAPGILRVAVKNEGTAHWMGAICAIESRDHSPDETAEMMYDAEELTPIGGAFLAFREGASEGIKEVNNVVKTGGLSSNWAAVLHSKIFATGKQMTHIGPRRVLLRIWDPNAAASQIRFRLEWRVLGSTTWITNEEQETQLVGDFSYIDLGEVRPEIAKLGSQRWEFRISARTTGSIGQEAELDCVFPLTTEQYVIIQEYLASAEVGQTFWYDNFAQTEGNATGKTAPIGGTYEGFKTGADFVVKPSKSAITRTAKNGRIVIASKSKVAYTSFTGITRVPGPSVETGLGEQGYVFRWTNENNYFRVSFLRTNIFKSFGAPEEEGCRLVATKVVGGVESVVAESSVRPEWLYGGELSVTITTAGLLTVNANGKTVWSFKVSALEAGQPLAEGKMGVYDYLGETNVASPERIWQLPNGSSFAGNEETIQAVCYAGRSMEFRSEGLFRQHLADDVWARLVPDGFLPYAAPSGLEKRALKGIVIPTVGNFEKMPDSKNIKGSVKGFYFPAYHFTSEAI
jgi:hypothetical protein